MPQTVRTATTDDISRLVELLLCDAAERYAEDAILWKMVEDAPTQIEKALTFALTAEQQPFRQIWQVAEDRGKVTGVIHSMMLPVPPIYAGAHGEPGLILPDSFTEPDAPGGTVDALVDAAEEALHEAGAPFTVSSFVAGKDWQDTFQRRGYTPLTLYLSVPILEKRECRLAFDQQRRQTFLASLRAAPRTDKFFLKSTRSSGRFIQRQTPGSLPG